MTEICRSHLKECVKVEDAKLVPYISSVQTPDYGIHSGKVIPTPTLIMSKHIIPMALGPDIGCGVSALKINMSDSDLNEILTRRNEVYRKFDSFFLCKENYINYEDYFDLIINQLDELSFITEAEPAIFDELDNVSVQEKNCYINSKSHFYGMYVPPTREGEQRCIYLIVHCGAGLSGYSLFADSVCFANKLNSEICSAVPKKWGLWSIPTCVGEYEEFDYQIENMNELALTVRVTFLGLMYSVLKKYGKVEASKYIDIPNNGKFGEAHFSGMTPRVTCLTANKQPTGEPQDVEEELLVIDRSITGTTKIYIASKILEGSVFNSAVFNSVISSEETSATIRGSYFTLGRYFSQYKYLTRI